MESEAAVKPISILDPNRKIFRKSQRNNMRNNIEYKSGFFNAEYVDAVACKSQKPDVHSAINPI